MSTLHQDFKAIIEQAIADNRIDTDKYDVVVTECPTHNTIRFELFNAKWNQLHTRLNSFEPDAIGTLNLIIDRL